jgi:hypothetical protein
MRRRPRYHQWRSSSSSIAFIKRSSIDLNPVKSGVWARAD